METRRKSRKSDPIRGDRPYIGYRKDGKQQRFSLGADPLQAKLREDRIRQLYLESLAARKGYGQEMGWTEAALHAAKHIASGLQHIPLPSPSVVNEAIGDGWEIGGYDACWEPSSPQAIIWSHAIASRLYPSVHWVLPVGNAGQNAVSYGQMLYDIQARRQARVLNATTPESPVSGTFFEALDKYTKYLEETLAEKLSPGSAFNRLRYVSYFKIRHTDFPLLALDFNKCDELISFWKNRPTLTKNVDNKEETDRYIHKTARQILAELDRFFDWLDFRGGYGWSKPRHFDNIDRTVTKDPVKRSIKHLISKPTFSLEELSKINMECDALQRMLLYFGLNCAFGASEVGRLEFDDLYLRKANPLEHCWHNQNFKANPSESWVAFLRPKTGVAGCWWLFPETVDAIEAWLKVRPQTDVQRIVVSEVGTSLYRDKSKNAQSGFRTQWEALLKRAIKKHPALHDGKSIRLLPFGTLRDQLPDWAVGNGESESGSIALAHGCPFKDDLLTCYSNRPFPRMFEVQRRYREFLKPVFDALNDKP